MSIVDEAKGCHRMFSRYDCSMRIIFVKLKTKIR